MNLTMVDERMERVRGVAAKGLPRERSNIEWARIRVVILDALVEFPGAREAVVAALMRVFMKEQSEDSPPAPLMD